MALRRIVTGLNDDGRSVVVSDGIPPRTHDMKSLPGMTLSVGWGTEPGIPIDRTGSDPTTSFTTTVPGPGGSRLSLLVIPPDSGMATPEFDPVGFGAELAEYQPGLAEVFEENGMHVTPTVDYTFVLEGEILLVLEEGAPTPVSVGDVVIQNGTRHAWSNQSDKRAVLAAVLLGGEFAKK